MPERPRTWDAYLTGRNLERFCKHCWDESCNFSIGEGLTIVPIERRVKSALCAEICSLSGAIMISVPTRRFGTVERDTKDVLTFPSGIFGFELSLRWLLLGDQAHGGLYWLQNIEDVDLSFPVVEPREFVDEYKLQVSRQQLASISFDDQPLLVLSVLTEYDGQLCLNLRNPIVINPRSMTGGQVVSSDDRPLQYALSAKASLLRKTA